LYADDTILLAESREDLQLLLNTFSEYCLEWKLKINVNKTKALIFSKERIENTLKFYINNEEIEIVKNFKYLGVIFARSGSCLVPRKYLQEQAKATVNLL
jgi:hypothetical protein